MIGLLEELQAVTRLPMDSPKKPSPPSTPEPSPMPSEGDSAGVQAISEVLAKDLSNLTLKPRATFPSLPPKRSPKQQDKEQSLQGLGPRLGQSLLYRRRLGVRTVAMRQRMERALLLARYRTLSLLKKDPQEGKLETESRFRRFRCSCHYCLYHGDPSDNINMENNYDMELI
ncbi:developmental pluripotency-associated protein 3-like [Molossus molossus]|uniref:developmental pluripotency-associated protein 3-like n=1 Tax=Molossus molossus TaxID=27622 RepID=UPI001746D156|nr:developmental pluripotency-associated protein 3-like [Molossus molossus]